MPIQPLEIESEPDDSEAWLFKENGVIRPVLPANGTDFSVDELQGFVKGFFKLIFIDDGRRIAVVNEDGIAEGYGYNSAASSIAEQQLLGDVLICPAYMVR